MVDRPDLLSAWLGQHLPVADVLPFGAITDSPYDESDHGVFEWYGTIDHLGQSVARRCLRYDVMSVTATGRCSANAAVRSCGDPHRIERRVSGSDWARHRERGGRTHRPRPNMPFRRDLETPAPGSTGRSGVRWTHPAQKTGPAQRPVDGQPRQQERLLARVL